MSASRSVVHAPSRAGKWPLELRPFPLSSEARRGGRAALSCEQIDHNDDDRSDDQRCQQHAGGPGALGFGSFGDVGRRWFGWTFTYHDCASLLIRRLDACRVDLFLAVGLIVLREEIGTRGIAGSLRPQFGDTKCKTWFLLSVTQRTRPRSHAWRFM